LPEEHGLHQRDVADKQKHLQYMSMDEAITLHKGIGIWRKASTMKARNRTR
jgi:phosphoketolase